MDAGWQTFGDNTDGQGLVAAIQAFRLGPQIVAF